MAVLLKNDILTLIARQPIACSIHLCEIGTQPLNARSSISPVTPSLRYQTANKRNLLSTMCFSLKDIARNKNINISDTTFFRTDIIAAACLGGYLGFLFQYNIVNAGWHDNTSTSAHISMLYTLLGAIIFGMSAIKSPLKLELLCEKIIGDITEKIENFLDSIPTNINNAMDQCKLNKLSFFSRSKVNTLDINKQYPKALKIR